MLLHSRSVFAAAILLLSLVPAWSKTERVVLRGNTFVFEVPDNLSPDPHNLSRDPVGKRSNSDLQTYQDQTSNETTFLLFGYEPDRVDFRHYVVDPGPIERINSVSIARSTKIVEMAASVSACGGKCFIVVKLTPDPVLYDRSRGEALFQRYVRALDSRSFEQSAAR